MEKIQNIIIDYCLENEPKYALLIDGTWGEGKTYFLKNNIQDILNKSNKEFIYVSLNGIENTKEIFNQIINYKLSKKTNGVSETKAFKIVTGLGLTALNGISNFFSVGTAEDISAIKLTDLLNYENTIICFDDLERISSKLNIEDVLGFINTNFVEHNNINTIIVCDKSKIDKIDKVEKSFDVIKEKIIGRTIKFEYTIEEVIKLFETEISKIDSNFYNKNEQTIVNFFHQTKTKNLRTVFFMTDNLKRLMPIIDNEIDNETIHYLINFILIVSNEYKNGKFERDKYFYQNNNFKHNKTADRLFATDLSDKDEFKLTYQNLEYNYFDSIYDFIINGYFDGLTIKKNIEEINSIIIKNKDEPEYILLKKIYNWSDYNEVQFNNIIKELQSNFGKNIYPLFNIVYTIRYWQIFVGYNLIENFGIHDFDELDNYLSKIIGNLAFKDAEFDTLKLMFPRDKNSNYTSLEKTDNAIKKKLDEFCEIYNKADFNERLILIKEDVSRLSGTDDFNAFTYLFDNMNSEELSSLVIYFLEKDNKDFHIFHNKLCTTFNYSNAGEHNYDYKKNIDELILALTNVQQTKDKIKRHLLNKFIDELKSKSMHLESTKR